MTHEARQDAEPPEVAKSTARALGPKKRLKPTESEKRAVSVVRMPEGTRRGPLRPKPDRDFTLCWDQVREQSGLFEQMSKLDTVGLEMTQDYLWSLKELSVEKVTEALRSDLDRIDAYCLDQLATELPPEDRAWILHLQSKGEIILNMWMASRLKMGLCDARDQIHPHTWSRKEG